MAKVPINGAMPVYVPRSRAPSVVIAAVCSPHYGFAQRSAQALFQFSGDVPHHLASGMPCLLRHNLVQGYQRGCQMDIRLQRRQQFRLRKHLRQTQALQSVALQQLNDGSGKIAPNIAQPAVNMQ
jgi:hypothetical protein